MIKKEMGLNYYNYGEGFYGSYYGMRYYIERIGEKPEFLLQVTVWPEPFCFDVTDDSLKKSITRDFTEDGYESVMDWLNEEHKNYE